MRVVVTGAGGFVGSHVCRALLDAGHEVVAVVRRPSAGPLLRGARVTETDLAGQLAIDGPVDAVVHAAAALRDGADHARDNVDATRNVLAWAGANGAGIVVLTSSTSVYGPVTAPILTEDQPCIPTDLYGRTKLQAERLVAAAGMPGAVLRLPGVLGPAASPGPWLVRSAAACLVDKPVIIRNPDAAFNAAVHVVDLAALCAAIVVSPPSSLVTANLAAAGSVSIRHAVEMLRVRLASSSPIVVEPSASSPYVIDTGVAEQSLGYRPTPITDVLERFAHDLSTEAEGAPRA